MFIKELKICGWLVGGKCGKVECGSGFFDFNDDGGWGGVYYGFRGRGGFYIVDLEV